MAFAINTDLGLAYSYPGVPHGFNGVAENITASKKWEQDYRDGIRWLLQKCQ